MKIGLIDCDSHRFPNIPLMKISAWHKGNGDEVEWYSPFDKYDTVYCAKVFSFTPDYPHPITNADRVIKGGTGYEFRRQGEREVYEREGGELPNLIEHIYPDYSLYPDLTQDTAFGFLSRGCPRGCSFCIVGQKEGMRSRKVADLDEFWRGQKNIVLCDPNILACREWEDLLAQLANSKSYVDINQGLDVRLLTKEKIEALNRVKIKEIHFAWDRYKDKKVVLPKFELYAQEGKMKPHGHNAIVFVLCNYDTTIKQDLERIYMLRDMGYWAYVMLYDKQRASRKHRDLQRWCNNRFIFGSCPRFEDYGKNENEIVAQTLF